MQEQQLENKVEKIVLALKKHFLLRGVLHLKTTAQKMNPENTKKNIQKDTSSLHKEAGQPTETVLNTVTQHNNPLSSFTRETDEINAPSSEERQSEVTEQTKSKQH